VGKLRRLLTKVWETIDAHKETAQGVGGFPEEVIRSVGDLLGASQGRYSELLEHMGKDLDDLPTVKQLDEFVEWWNDGTPGGDVATKCHPKKEGWVILWAGEMTWGDEPSGYGYNMLHGLGEWGLLYQLGIE
jgi:hypothetical protein